MKKKNTTQLLMAQMNLFRIFSRTSVANARKEWTTGKSKKIINELLFLLLIFNLTRYLFTCTTNLH